MIMKTKILELHHRRYALIENIQQMGEDDPREKELNDEVDNLTREIIDLIKESIAELEFDFIMDQLANMGHCPNLLNDDNGHWAVTCDGYQNVVFGDETQDVETHFYVEAKQWKDTPKEALKVYLTEEEYEEE